jgi:hypothetical protein
MDSAARPDEEEARRRRSTDCIYFLASPLTCKKVLPLLIFFLISSMDSDSMARCAAPISSLSSNPIHATIDFPT